MAVGIQDHIHLGTDNPPTNIYPVVDGTLDLTPGVQVAFDRGLTGVLHTHRLVDDSGNPVQFCNDKMRLRLTLAEMLVVKELIGKTVYYVPNYHDDVEDGDSLDVWPDSDYVVRGVLMVQPGSLTNINAMCTHWLLAVEIVDDSAVT